MTSEHPDFVGIYDAPTVARYLLAGRMAGELYPVTARNLINWIRSGLAQPDLAEVPGRKLILSFEDMISMRVIAALRAHDVDWTLIHNAEGWLRETTGHDRPFATEQLWTANSDVFTKLRNQIVSAGRQGQLALGIIEDYLIPISGLKFERQLARRWEPRDFIELDPLVQFGAPVVKGTRVPTKAIWGMIRAGDPLVIAAHAYRITEEQARAAVEWEDALAA